MNRWKDRFWPTIDSPQSARRAVDRAARVTTISALVCIAVGLVLLFSGAKATEPGRGEALTGAAFLIPGFSTESSRGGFVACLEAGHSVDSSSLH